MADQVKPGRKTTEFWGKCALQFLLILNIILQALGRPAVPVSAEVSAAVASGLEGLWLVWRQWSKTKAAELATKLKIAELEAAKKNGG